MAVEAVAAGVSAICGMRAHGVADASVEALDHAVGLRVIGLCELVADAMVFADAIEGVVACTCVA